MATNPNLIDGNGKTLLMHAAENDNLQSAIQLVAYGADCERVDNLGFSALACAASKGSKSVVKFLINIGARIDAKSMAESLNAEILELLLNSSEIINLNHFRYNTRPLIFAFTYIQTEECYKKLHMFVRHGADPNTTDLYLDTPLMSLVKNVKEDDNPDKLYWVAKSIKLLIYMGADYSRANGFLETFETLLIENKNRVKLLDMYMSM